MTKLGCNADKCVNNLGGFCTASIIHIDGLNAHSSSGTQCDTFAEKNFTNAFKSLVNTNYSGEIMQLINTDERVMNPQIKCDALNCSFNSNQSCSASNVQVFGPRAISVHGTQCETFISK